MSFYSRKIPYYKSFRTIDTDGDGIIDAISYKPYGDFYYIQFGMEQTVKNIGHYNLGVDKDFEVISLGGIWDESNDGSNDNNPDVIPNLGDITGGTTGTDLQGNPNLFCNDSGATNYNPSLLSNPNFQECEDFSCCTYLNTTDYSSGTPNTGTDFTNVDCLVLYTDWGPWNENLLVNDTNQIYVTKTDCVLTFRMINQNGDLEFGPTFGSAGNDLIPGGWYGASIKIEIDNGLGWETITETSAQLLDMETTSSGYSDISYDPIKESFTLSNKVKIWPIKSGGGFDIDYYSTRPYRDLTIKVSANSTIKVTYLNGPLTIPKLGGGSFTTTNSEKLKKKLRLQLIKGTKFTPTPFRPSNDEPENDWEYYDYVTSIPNINSFLPTIPTRYGDGETFHFISNGTVFSDPPSLSDMKNYWNYYLGGYGTFSSSLVPWSPSNTMIPAGDFYVNPNIDVINDFGDNVLSTIISEATDPSLNPIANPFVPLVEFDYNCDAINNFVSYFDKNGDGFIEYDENYPLVDTLNPGSVDSGLFSKTRYDSPYVYIAPGANGNGEPLLENDLTSNFSSQATIPVGTLSSAGWRQYGYLDGSPSGLYVFKNASPTCQMGGCDKILNSNPNLVDESNSNIFLPQSDYNVAFDMSSCANVYDGTSYSTVPLKWNVGNTDAKGGCCAKRYDSSLIMSQNGPWLSSKCSRCHKQMTTRSAQPIFDNNTKIQMQTTDSDVYYGPFYDPQNPTYNGYGLAFSRANKFCRDVKNKNGVKILNTSGSSVENLYVGGILHGAATQVTPTTDINSNYGVTQSSSAFDVVGTGTGGNLSCSSSTKLPLKCQRVIDDPNCPNRTKCMKCLYCFKCVNEEKQPGIFTGNNEPTDGASDGIEIIG